VGPGAAAPLALPLSALGEWLTDISGRRHCRVVLTGAARRLFFSVVLTRSIYICMYVQTSAAGNGCSRQATSSRLCNIFQRIARV